MMREKREGTFRTWSEDDSDVLSRGYRSAQAALIEFPRGSQKQRTRLTGQRQRGEIGDAADPGTEEGSVVGR